MYRLTSDLVAVRDPTPTCRSSTAGRGMRGRAGPGGALARELDVRLSSHPGQYIVLNSESAGRRARRPRPPGPGRAARPAARRPRGPSSPSTRQRSGAPRSAERRAPRLAFDVGPRASRCGEREDDRPAAGERRPRGRRPRAGRCPSAAPRRRSPPAAAAGTWPPPGPGSATACRQIHGADGSSAVEARRRTRAAAGHADSPPPRRLRAPTRPRSVARWRGTARRSRR